METPIWRYIIYSGIMEHRLIDIKRGSDETLQVPNKINEGQEFNTRRIPKTGFRCILDGLKQQNVEFQPQNRGVQSTSNGDTTNQNDSKQRMELFLALKLLNYVTMWTLKFKALTQWTAGIDQLS